MRPLAAAIGLAFLAGCTFTPSELRQQGDRFSYSSARPPRAVAACMARNAENFQALGATFQGEWRDGLAPGAMEVLVRVPGNTLITADVEPAPNGGSSITIWQNTVEVFYRELQAEMVKGC